MQWSPVPEKPKTSSVLNERDDALVEWLTNVRYATTTDTARWLEESDRATAYRAKKLADAGYVQGAYVAVNHRRTRIWTASRHAPRLMQDLDSSWEQDHPHWHAVSDQDIAGHAVAHALARNRVCLDMMTNADQLQWGAVWNFPTPRFVIPTYAAAVVPDALMLVHGHLWCIEMERSWRGSTLQRKLVQYQALYDKHAWGHHFPIIPRVLLVLSETSTQQRSLSAWLADIDRMPRSWAVVLPWSEVLREWRPWVWTPTGVRQQISWVTLHSQPVQRAPTPPPLPEVNLRRLLKRRPQPDLPWEDH